MRVAALEVDRWVRRRNQESASGADFCDDLLEARRRDDVVVHEDQVALRTVKVFDAAHELRQRCGVALGTLQLWNAAEVAFADAAPRGVSQIGIPNWVAIGDLVQDCVVRYEILNGP